MVTARTTIAQLGGKICVNDRKEHLIPALGNNAAKPGDMCGIDAADGKLKAVNDGTYEDFLGILKEHVLYGVDTAIPTNVPCSLIVPKSGHRYRVRIENSVDIEPVGTPLWFAAVAYHLDETNAAAESCCARLSLPVLHNDDSVAEVTWD